MVRIADEMIERIKREASLVKLIEMADVQLQKQGSDLVGCCPFHNDKTPSLVVSVEKNLWHCLGACQKGGSVIDWVMQSQALSFRDAVQLLTQNYFNLMDLPQGSAEGQMLLKRVVEHYHHILKDSPAGLKYLMKRGLYHSEMIDAFQIGFVDSSLLELFAQDAEVSRQLQALGILRGPRQQHFQNCLVFPIFNADGTIGEIYGRKTDAKEQQTKHLYLPGPHCGVFNGNSFKAYDEIIVCESIIDALSFWVAGMRHVTASFGADGLTNEMLQAMQEYGVHKVVLAYDDDEAGNRGASKAAEKL